MWQVSAVARDRDAPYSAVRRMLQALLSEPFGLQAVSESVPVPTIVLTLDGEPGPGLRPSTADVDCRPFLEDLKPPHEMPRTPDRIPMCGGGYLGLNPPRLLMRSVRLTNFAHSLEIDLGRVVVVDPLPDGLFDIDFRFPAGFDRRDIDSLDSEALAAALQEQLGLSVLVTTRPVSVLKIIRAVRPGEGVPQ